MHTSGAEYSVRQDCAIFIRTAGILRILFVGGCQQTAYQKRYDELATRYDRLKQEIDSLSEKIHDTQSRKGSVEDFHRAFEKTPDSLPEFSLDAFTGLVDHLTVYAKDDIRVTFRNGQEVNA